MITKEFLETINKINLNLEKYFGNMSRKERIFQDALKLNEEVGELSGEILTHFGKQRKIKLDNKQEENLKMEFADVLLTTLILAKSMDIDINEALKIKLDKIENRGGF